MSKSAQFSRKNPGNSKPFVLFQPVAPLNSKWTVVTMAFIDHPSETKSRTNTYKTFSICSPKFYNLFHLLIIMIQLARQEISWSMSFETIFYIKKTISDHKSIFMSKFWKTLFGTLDEKISPSTAYHPQTKKTRDR